MSGEIEARLASLGITLPGAAAPAANYVPGVVTGNLIFVSGQIPIVDGAPQFIGKIGREFSIEEGQAAARICAINVLAVLKSVLDNLDRVVQVVKLTGFVNVAPDFNDPQKVVNGASDLIVEAFGDLGRHSRAAVGVATLPLGVAVEVEAIVEFL